MVFLKLLKRYSFFNFPFIYLFFLLLIISYIPIVANDNADIPAIPLNNNVFLPSFVFGVSIGAFSNSKL